jgi:hypothetical protein
MSQDNPYDVLGISTSAEPEVVQAAYRALARKYHPDLNPEISPEELTKRMAKINWARSELESNAEQWRRKTRQHASNPESQRRPADTPHNAYETMPPSGAVSTEPQVLHLTGVKGASGVLQAWADGTSPDAVRARFYEGVINVERLAAAGGRATFSVTVQDDFKSDIKDNLVLPIEFNAPGFVGAKAFVSVAPIHQDILSQRRGERVAPTRHVSETARISFGKHRGRPFKEIALEEPGYLEWILREGAGSHIERECARRALELQFGGAYLARPAGSRREAESLPAQPSPLRALPDPDRPGGILRLLKGVFGQKN